MTSQPLEPESPVVFDLASNARFGSKRVNLSGSRYVAQIVEGTEPFPLGIKGLLQVVTLRRGGSKHVCYAFHDADACEALINDVMDANAILYDACDLADFEFGAIDRLVMGIPADGWGFTRVEYVPYDKRGNKSPTPLRLYLETCKECKTPGTIQGVFDHDADGSLSRVELTDWETKNRGMNIIVSRTQGRLSIHKIERVNNAGRHGVLVYKEGMGRR